jgi:hypothetical protein
MAGNDSVLDDLLLVIEVINKQVERGIISKGQARSILPASAYTVKDIPIWRIVASAACRGDSRIARSRYQLIVKWLGPIIFPINTFSHELTPSPLLIDVASLL